VVLKIWGISFKRTIDEIEYDIKSYSCTLLNKLIALEEKNLGQIVEVEFGDLIDYRERKDIQTLYKKMFSI